MAVVVVVVVVVVVGPYRAVPGPAPEPVPSAFLICMVGGQVKEWKFIYHKNRVTRAVSVPRQRMRHTYSRH
uniref:Putative secreted protein n=1 Tax=Anopheles darlingi TaxID=43151 RepID=A0A2M4D6G4_ANODA